MKKRGIHAVISEEERKKIFKLQKRLTVTEISRVLNRPTGSISRVLRAKEKPPVKKGFFDYNQKFYA